MSLAVPVSPRSAVGVPVGAKANVAIALRRGDFDVVHGFDPAVAGLSYVALLESETTTVATFVDPERLGVPAAPQRSATGSSLGSTGSSRRVTTSPHAPPIRFPGAYATVGPPVSTWSSFAPGAERRAAS